MFASSIIFLYHQIPNIDGILAKWGIVDHGDFFHTPAIGLFVSAPLLSFSIELFFLGFFSFLLHLVADIPTYGNNFGIMVLYPFSEKKHTLGLWKDTGFFGWDSILGYYRQRWAVIFEGLVLLVFVLQ